VVVGVHDEVRGFLQRAEQLALAVDPVHEAAVALQGMAAAHLLEPAHEHGVGRFEEQQARRVAAAVELLDHRREVGGEGAAAHVHDDGDAGDLAAGPRAEVDHRVMRARGRLSTTNQPRSSNTAAVLRPAPETPLNRGDVGGRSSAPGSAHPRRCRSSQPPGRPELAVRPLMALVARERTDPGA
jgi:hypothetical protein